MFEDFPNAMARLDKILTRAVERDKDHREDVRDILIRIEAMLRELLQAIDRRARDTH